MLCPLMYIIMYVSQLFSQKITMLVIRRSEGQVYDKFNRIKYIVLAYVMSILNLLRYCKSIGLKYNSDFVYNLIIS